VDYFVDFLQRAFAKTVMWGNVGGRIAEQMVRAAFAPIISLSQLAPKVKQLVELMDMELKLMEESGEKDKRLAKALQEEVPELDLVRKRYVIANRMRQFYSEMKKSISEALEKRR
jgi:hypothetical protein